MRRKYLASSSHFLISKFHWDTRKSRWEKRRSTMNAMRENVEIVGIVKSAGHRGEQLYNPNLSRDFRPLICFLASRNRNRGYLLRANDRSSYEFRGNIFDNAVASRFAPFLHRLSLYWIKENKVEPSPRTRVRNKN